MLKNLDPLLTPDLLYVLRAMGHGDVLTLVDSNFPADSVAATTVHGEPIRLDGVGIPEAARAILSVFPLDSFIEAPLQYMQVVGEPDTKLEVHQDLHQIALEGTDRDWKLGSGRTLRFLRSGPQDLRRGRHLRAVALRLFFPHQRGDRSGRSGGLILCELTN